MTRIVHRLDKQPPRQTVAELEGAWLRLSAELESATTPSHRAAIQRELTRIEQAAAVLIEAVQS